MSVSFSPPLEWLVTLQLQCRSAHVIIKLSGCLCVTWCELFIVSWTTAISLSFLTAVKKQQQKNSRVKVCSQDFGSAIFFPHRSLPKLSKGAFEALKLPQQELQSGAHHLPARLWVWGLCIVATSQRLRVPPTPWLLLSCATTSQYFVFSSGRLRGGLPHHCAGTAGFIKHLTSSRYLMVHLNQGAAGPHSRN